MAFVVNMTIIVQLSSDIDLHTLHDKSDDIVYSPRSFSGAKYRCFNPCYSALIFRTGKVTLTGVTSISKARQAADHLANYLTSLGLNITVVSLNVKNQVISFNAERTIDLPKFYNLHKAESSYEIELFPGLIYRNSIYGITMLIFSSGKIIVTGIKATHQMDDITALLNSIKHSSSF